jgi:hypothetical protein
VPSLTVRVLGRDLPGRDCGEPRGTVCWRNVHVGLQRGRDPSQLLPGDAPEARFELVLDVVERPGGGRDFRGPYVHGKPGERFLYLTWGEVRASGAFAMFRRIKLFLADVPPVDLAHALEGGGVLEAELGLTDPKGGPACGGHRPPKVRWRVASG